MFMPPWLNTNTLFGNGMFFLLESEYGRESNHSTTNRRVDLSKLGESEENSALVFRRYLQTLNVEQSRSLAKDTIN